MKIEFDKLVKARPQTILATARKWFKRYSDTKLIYCIDKIPTVELSATKIRIGGYDPNGWDSEQMHIIITKNEVAYQFSNKFYPPEVSTIFKMDDTGKVIPRSVNSDDEEDED